MKKSYKQASIEKEGRQYIVVISKIIEEYDESTGLTDYDEDELKRFGDFNSYQECIDFIKSEYPRIKIYK